MQRNAAITIVVIFLVLAGIFLLTQGGSDNEEESVRQPAVVSTASGSQEGNVREIPIRAQRFEFTPAVIRIKEGEKVKLIITNADTTHGINIPAFNVKGTDSVELTADKKGTFQFYCTTYCGAGHPEMKGTIIVE